MLFIFSKFKLRKWKKLSPDKRFKVIVALEKKVAGWLGIEPVKVELKEDSDHWNSFGVFVSSAGDGKIILNENLLYDLRYRFHAIETIAHETRHAYQYSIISKDLKWYEFTAKKWKRNWTGYVSSLTDELLYNNQAVERDAQKYSIKILKKVKGKFSGETDFQHTFDAVVYRYDQSEINAKKRYGFFYKQKIEKDIKNNNRY